MRSILRVGAAAAAAALAILGANALPFESPKGPAAGGSHHAGSGDAAPATTDIRMNQIQFMGAHNAYHRELQGDEQAEALKIDPGIPTWTYYSHARIPDLLARQNVRHVELDLLPDPDGGLYRHPLPRKRLGLPPIDDPGLGKPGMKVQHVPDVDYNSTCRTFVRCLRQVEEFSTANPGHSPIVVQVELKQTDDRWEAIGGAVSPPWDKPLLDDIDTEIRSVFSDSDLITPDDLRRPGSTLEQSILKHGWPKLSWARGKVMFYFDSIGSDSPLLPAYLEGHPNLEGRAVFPRGEPGDAHAAVMQINDPRGDNAAQIRERVKAGYFVRTRSDEGQKTIREQDYTRHPIALESGAQLSTTDYPTIGMAARWDSDFVAELPGGAAVRCNPVNAPSGCRVTGG